MSWVYSDSKQTLHFHGHVNNGMLMEDYIPNNEWTLLKHKAERNATSVPNIPIDG